jgi:hypothetical protein
MHSKYHGEIFAVLHYLAWNVTHPFAQHIHAVYPTFC